ncbi:MAG TPA: chemotaxis protein CheW [Gammaproteobacteria bacterium]|jgi:chemosensory pili system protein ChpC|nr:chemotaxis protein CheW [Gammaproteobacteria bacterium]HET7587573.1 chemotaxis protein CheW [Gammaproteobacteria bacterium]
MAERLDEVYSLLIPVADARLLLPRLAVAEITGFVRPRPPAADAPTWLLGRMPWHDITIPLVSFEAFCGRQAPEASRRARVAVLHAVGADIPERVFGLIIQGYPYLVRMNANVLHPAVDGDAEPWEGPVLARPRMANESPMIPDIEAMAASVAGLQPAAVPA